MVLASSICSNEGSHPWLPLEVPVATGEGYSIHLVDSDTGQLYAASGNFSLQGDGCCKALHRRFSAPLIWVGCVSSPQGAFLEPFCSTIHDVFLSPAPGKSSANLWVHSP